MDTNSIKIWLDDERLPPEGWTRCQTAPECIALLSHIHVSGHTVDVISLDHDLGNDNEGTGYTVLCWIEEQIANDDAYVKPNQILIHTANPSARQKMMTALEGLKRLCSMRTPI